MTTRQLRLVRAAAASSTATILAAVSHTVGGGMPPHPLLVVALSVLLIPLAVALIGRRPSATRTTATVLVSQVVFHTLFHVLGATLPAAVNGPAGHAHHLVLLAPSASTTVAPDAPMLVSHLIAALLTTVLLWHGERMLRGIAGWVSARLLPPQIVSPMRHERRLTPSWPLVTTPLTPLTAVVSRRGPPASI